MEGRKTMNKFLLGLFILVVGCGNPPIDSIVVTPQQRRMMQKNEAGYNIFAAPVGEIYISDFKYRIHRLPYEDGVVVFFVKDGYNEITSVFIPDQNIIKPVPKVSVTPKPVTVEAEPTFSPSP